MAKNISCIEAMTKLQAYLDNEIGGPTEEDIDAHIHDCRECFSRAEFEKSLRKKVSDTAVREVPTDLQERLNALIDRF